jgi:hypothetical protein
MSDRIHRPLISEDCPWEYNPLIPDCSAKDVGRRVARTGSSSYKDWSAIGVVIDFQKLYEVRTDGSFSMDGEIGSSITEVHGMALSDTW